MNRTRLLPILLLLASSCTLRVPPELHAPPQSVAVTSGGTARSASYLLRVDGGVVVFDLGWWGAAAALDEGLRQLEATPDDVVAVFLTHAHRDHIGAWRRVRRARFHIAAPEVEQLFGYKQSGGLIPRIAEKLKPSDLPGPGELTLHTFDADTFFVFGRDTVRTFLVPGHTVGSAVYLFRGTVFAGDAIGWSRLTGFRPAHRAFSDDVAAAVLSLQSLRQRLAPYRVHTMCSAHLECSAVTAAFWAELLRRTVRS